MNLFLYSICVFRFLSSSMVSQASWKSVHVQLILAVRPLDVLGKGNPKAHRNTSAVLHSLLRTVHQVYMSSFTTSLTGRKQILGLVVHIWRLFSTEMHGQAATFRSTCGFVPKAPGALALTRSELQTDWKTEKVPMKNKVKNTKSKTKQVNNHKPCTAVRRRTWESKVFPNKSRAFIMRAEV